jgi:hypothetical protein
MWPTPILVIRQGDLWAEGIRAGEVLKSAPIDEEADDEDSEETAEEGGVSEETWREVHLEAGDYVAGKWGRFLRAPDLYFELMRRFRDHFVRLGEIAEVRFGVKSGCDAFFIQ